MHRPDVAAFFDPRTCSLQYVVSDPRTKAVCQSLQCVPEGTVWWIGHHCRTIG